MSGNQAHLRKTGSPSGRADGAYAEGPYAEGLALAAAGRHGEAIASFEKALEKRPDDSHTLFALGVTAQEIGHSPAAETFFRRVLAQEPDRIEALVQLAQVMRSGGRFSEVIGLLTPALERKPETPELWLTLGNALREAGDTAHARSFYDEAVRLKPDYAAALGNIADLIADDGRTEEALALYKRVLSLEPHQAQARLNRAILLLSMGDLARGWRDYAYRIHCKGKVPTPTHGLPKWNGRVMKRTRLLVTSEQGVGDQIAFASMIPDLANRAAQAGGEIILEAEPRLVPLFARSFSGITVMPADLAARGGRITAHYDWLEKAGGAAAAVEMGTLAQHLRRKLTDFPDHTFYLTADENLRAEFAQWLRGQGDGPYIGLCWRSGKSGGLRNQNFAPLEMWAAFARDLPGTLVSLQYDAHQKKSLR